jgi:hypothetical protein
MRHIDAAIRDAECVLPVMLRRCDAAKTCCRNEHRVLIRIVKSKPADRETSPV